MSRQPDDNSWTLFVGLYTPLIHGWVRRYFVKEEDVEDLAQEVMTVVVRELAHFRHNQQRGAFRNWFAHRHGQSAPGPYRGTRRGRAEASGDSDIVRMLDQLADPNSSLSQLWDQQHDQYVVRRLMELIEPQFEAKTWQAFREVALDGTKPAIVAEKLGMSVNAVLIAKCRVVNRLRQELRGLTD